MAASLILIPDDLIFVPRVHAGSSTDNFIVLPPALAWSARLASGWSRLKLKAGRERRHCAALWRLIEHESRRQGWRVAYAIPLHCLTYAANLSR